MSYKKWRAPWRLHSKNINEGWEWLDNQCNIHLCLTIPAISILLLIIVTHLI